MQKAVFGVSKSEAVGMRRLDCESILANAIAKRVLVTIRFENDLYDRLIVPYGIYKSVRDEIFLVCMQVDDPGKPLDSWKPRNFEVQLMTCVKLSGMRFQPDTRFDSHDARYGNGFICCV